jgi:type IX secretion system PorP/SprF family membrane protein
MKTKIILLLSLLGLELFAQDIHFSHFDNAPLFLNPSLTGSIKSQVRLIGNYKSQWNNISPNLFRTIATSVDANIKNEKLGVGLSFFKDVAGKSQLGLTQIAGSFSTKVQVTSKSSARVGFTGSFNQRAVNTSNLTWESQWQGQGFNTSIDAGESALNTNYTFIDIGAGALYQIEMNDDQKLNLGVSAFHINQPGFSLLSASDQLKLKYVIHSELELKMNESITMMPKAAYFVQGANRELIGGFVIRKSLGIDSKFTNYNKSSGVSLSVFYRWADAMIARVGYDHRGILGVNIGYDLNLSSFSNATQFRGGVELSIIYHLHKNTVRED